MSLIECRGEGSGRCRPGCCSVEILDMSRGVHGRDGVRLENFLPMKYSLWLGVDMISSSPLSKRNPNIVPISRRVLTSSCRSGDAESKTKIQKYPRRKSRCLLKFMSSYPSGYQSPSPKVPVHIQSPKSLTPCPDSNPVPSRALPCSPRIPAEISIPNSQALSLTPSAPIPFSMS